MKSIIINLIEKTKLTIEQLSEELNKLDEEHKQNLMEEMDDLISIKQITQQYYITEPTLKKYRDQNIIRPVNKGRRPFFKRQDVLRLLQNLKPRQYPVNENEY